MVFCQWYVIFIDGYTDRQIHTPTKLHTIFCWLYDKLSKGNTNRMKQVIFFWRTLSIYKSISKFITDELTNRPEITDKSFFNEMFLSVSPSVKYLPMNCECKYRRKFLSVKLLNLIVLNDDPFYIFFLILIEFLFILFSSFVWYFIFFVPFFNFCLSFCCLFFFLQFLWF